MRVLLALLLLPALGWANPVVGPDDAAFFVHVDIRAMQTSQAGQPLYDWIRDEMINEIEDELQLDITRQLEAVTVFGSGGSSEDAGVVLHGFFDESQKQRLLDKAGEEMNIRKSMAAGVEYYAISDNNVGFGDAAGKKREDKVFFAFGPAGQNLVTQSEELMQQFALSGGQFAVAPPQGLLVLKADRSLVAASVDAKSAGSDHWDSHIFQNIERAALVISDDYDALLLQATIEAVDDVMAESVSNIIQGFVSLQALANDEPEMVELVRQLEVETLGKQVQLGLRVPSQKLLEIID